MIGRTSSTADDPRVNSGSIPFTGMSLVEETDKCQMVVSARDEGPKEKAKALLTNA